LGTDPSQGPAEAVVSLGVFWLKAQSLSVARLGLHQAAQGTQCITEVVVTPRIIWSYVILWLSTVQLDRSANIIECHVISSDLVRDDAQQMQSLGMGRLDGQNLPIRCFGLLEAASSMLRMISFIGPEQPIFDTALGDVLRGLGGLRRRGCRAGRTGSSATASATCLGGWSASGR
jgi:hypothetical protein